MDIRRRALLKRKASSSEPEEPESGGSGTINVGDIAYWDGSKVKTVSSDKWSTSLGTPVGVVVIPEGFAPDGKVRIIGLKPVDSNGNQSVSNVVMKWGPNSINTSLTNYTKVPTTDNAGSTSTGSRSAGLLPSDNFTGAQSYVDPLSKYNGSSNLIPSPYLGDKPNQEYYKTISGYNNALSDFNGLSNTQTLVDLGSNYQAANACWKYKDGASNLQWYLPAMGELGYLMPRFNLINESLTAVSGVAVDGDNDLWSSSEFSLYYAFYLSTYSGSVSYLPKDYDGYVRPFCTIENNNGINTDDYLTIEALENGLTASLSTNACEYCVDGDGQWKSLAAGTTTESINSGHTLSFRGELSPTSSAGIGTFTISKKCNLKGNCMSMLFGGNAVNNFSLSGKNYAFYKLFQNCNIVNVSSNFLPATTLSNSCYYWMFRGCSSLTNAPKLPATKLSYRCYDSMFAMCSSLTVAPELPATTLAEDCYSGMFRSCSNLTTAPELPATTLAKNCYSSMFSNCSNLTTAPELPATTLAYACCYRMFNYCKNLVNAPELPATTLAHGCYDSMFDHCSNLKTAPSILPATTLEDSCYEGMFRYCTRLTTVPELPATTLASQCYQYMFQNCTSLTKAPELPATTLASNCYDSMFSYCTSLTTAPTVLPATTLANQCYLYMFNKCTSLTTAPELPATTLVNACYNQIFRDCSKLNYIKMLATDISANICLNGWVSNVASTGTFVKHPDMNSLPIGDSGIPSGWTVVNDGEEGSGNLTFPIKLYEGSNNSNASEVISFFNDLKNSSERLQQTTVWDFSDILTLPEYYGVTDFANMVTDYKNVIHINDIYYTGRMYVYEDHLSFSPQYVKRIDTDYIDSDIMGVTLYDDGRLVISWD